MAFFATLSLAEFGVIHRLMVTLLVYGECSGVFLFPKIQARGGVDVAIDVIVGEGTATRCLPKSWSYTSDQSTSAGSVSSQEIRADVEIEILTR